MKLDSLVDGKFSKGTKGTIILIFLVVPFISSIVSMLHVVKFLGLGNTSPVSITLALTYEIANLTILMAVVIMKNLRAFFVWTCFVVLLIVQIIGNVYYSYNYITMNIIADPKYLLTFISFIKEMMDFENTKTIVFVLSCFLGLPIPMVSLLLVKSVADYLELGGDEAKPAEFPAHVPGEQALEKIKEENTEKLGTNIVKIIDEQSVTEDSQEVIYTEEKHEPANIGVTIKPADDHNNEHRGQ